MNTTETKKIFYKRYGESGNFLHYTFRGALCNLLGSFGREGEPALLCALSMGVGMFARRLDGSAIKIQSTNSDRHFTYTPNMPPALLGGREREIAELITSLQDFGICGAQILYCNTLPAFIPNKTEFDAALTLSLMKVSGKDDDTAPTSPYPKSGYCILTDGGRARNYPLPLTGYKIITAYCPLKTTPSNRPEPPYHLAGERARIEKSVHALERCDLKTLLRAMNASERSMERHKIIRGDISLLAGYARGTDGVAAVRCSNNGAVIIVEDDYIDSAVNSICLDFENNIGYRPVFCISEPV